MSNPLAGMLRAQRDLQIESFGLDPANLEPNDRVEFIRWNVLALTDELHELLGEVGWKPWATSNHVNEDAAIGELIDALHFFMNILWAVAPDTNSPETLADDLVRRYNAKRRVNEQRQVDGYDGVTGKCRGCRRDLHEAGITEFETHEGVEKSCSACGCVVIS